MVDDDPYQQIEVQAPSDLEEGYLLDVELNGEVRTVIVVRSDKASLDAYLTSYSPSNSHCVVLPLLDGKPGGGVQIGETFVGFMLPQDQHRHRNDVPEGAVQKSKAEKEPLDATIPTGEWRDGFCDCCKYYAPVCCMGYCCGLGTCFLIHIDRRFMRYLVDG